ncbi:MAG: gamma-glutamyltransferase [Alphaproteobacteria bacterium]|jgi:gamma-glutamyltranspeptidase/glutathione hydrolase|nr:gamma-glutamyltransferase [Alphaproteobacteria bacterium]MDP6589177.1 gamma-glutamyltransferase [Alphaproteobacteria bacterium]MDP6818434.1 gamma-glutamyltransferase [Alphaproteobacteria bacterium]
MSAIDPTIMDGYRPVVRGRRHMAVAGHYLAAGAALQILEAGGNAVDAGVAGGLVLGVVHSEYVNFAGVAPIMIYSAETGRVETISGLGTWPGAVTPDLFAREHGGEIPEGLLRTVVPAAPCAWISALQRHGTISFADAAARAIDFAADGFVMYPFMADILATHEADYARWPSSAEIYLPGGAPPRTGDIFVQRDLAASIAYMVDEERAAAGKGRVVGLEAARDAFYRGDIAAKILRYHEENGGLLAAEDLAEFRSAVEAPLRTRFLDSDIYTCAAWCQGPVLAQALALLQPEKLRGEGHNTAAYIHQVTEALKLVFADRERYYGDPRFVDVPLERLLSPEYIAAQRALIQAKADTTPPSAGEPPVPRDTSYICVVDRHGNAFSATPSDVSYDTPVIPGTGLCPSSRGSQSWADAAHPSAVAPGKRPRLTPNPALAMRGGEFVMPFGTPGGDVQCQAMLQLLLNILLFGMNPQAAIEAPRFASYSFPNSFAPHEAFPGRLNLEGRIEADVRAALTARGHDVHMWPDWSPLAGALCLIYQDLERATLAGAADPRRPAMAAGY